MRKQNIVYENQKRCFLALKELYAQVNTTEELSELTAGTCQPHFDRSSCWPQTDVNTVHGELCPFVFCDNCDVSQRDRLVYRECQENGTWGAANYSNCINIMRNYLGCYESKCNECNPDTSREVVLYISMTLSLASLMLLCVSLIIFNSYKSIQCRRLSIHKHLAAAFVLRVFAFVLWTIVQYNHLFVDCVKQRSLFDWEWLCKSMLWFVIYFQSTSIFWMSVEGGYLVSRFTVFAMRSTEGPFWAYCLVGWGAPILPVSLWTVLHIHWEKPGVFCWGSFTRSPYFWIMTSTLGFALILNVLFLLTILVILMRKLKAESTAESKKIWATIKATLLLVPLLGISNIPLFYEPANASAVYHMISATLQYSQGIFIAILYCFCNGEIQNQLKRHAMKSQALETLFSHTEHSQMVKSRSRPSPSPQPTSPNGSAFNSKKNSKCHFNKTGSHVDLQQLEASAAPVRHTKTADADGSTIPLIHKRLHAEQNTYKAANSHENVNGNVTEENETLLGQDKELPVGNGQPE